MECKNCNYSFEGKYCPNCGQKYIERLGPSEVTEYVVDVIELHHGFLRTLFYLFVKPKVLIQDYIGCKTIPYQNPLKFFVTVIAISVIIQTFFSESPGEENELYVFFGIYALVIGVGFETFFRKLGYNLFENLIISTFIISQGIFIATILSLLIIIVPESFKGIINSKTLEFGLVFYPLFRIGLAVYWNAKWVIIKLLIIFITCIISTFIWVIITPFIIVFFENILGLFQ